MEQLKFLVAVHGENQYQKFLDGNEKGLEFIYHRLYPSLYYRCLRYIKDDVNADCIVSEAFLRLWLARKSITCPSQIETFLKKLTSDSCKAYFKTSNSRFHRNLLRLDELENYQDYMAGHDPRFDEDDQSIYQYELDDKIKAQWEKVDAVTPNLSSEQQLFVRLCIRYAFDYGRIAWHIGGISDYQVARKVEKTLACLKSIITDTGKLEAVGKRSKYRFEGDISDEQSSILHMRYELQYSFEEIATALNLDQGYIQQAFVTASLKVKKIKL
jgi:DNA-directed RNA polymerase specialized sigma24 family protein